jgi:membrane protease YdiL (CAAX protease family)
MDWNYWLFVLAVLALTGFIGINTFATARLLRVWTPDRNLLLLPGENLVRLALLGVCLGLGKLSGLGAEQLGWVAPRPGQQVALGLLIGLGMGLVFFVTTRWVIAKTGQRFYSSTLIEQIIPASRREFVLVTLALIPVVVLEELLFRSLLIGGLAPLLPQGYLVIGLGILFGLFHSPQGIWGMAGASLAGILFGLLFLWQGSLLLPAVTHFVVNMVQIVLALNLTAKGVSLDGTTTG